MKSIITVGYLGPKATFSHEASIKYFQNNREFNKSIEFIPVNKISDIFDKMKNDQIDYAVLPFENSTGGTIADTLDLFIKTDLKIFDQIILTINQNLLSITTKDKIKRIYAHYQSFMQCSEYISKNFKDVEIIEVSSNAKAAIMASEDKESAAIGPLLCAKEYNLNIIEEKINNKEDNETKFFVICKGLRYIFKNKSLIIFSVPNRAGSLYKVLRIFYKSNINMTKIESRPSKEKKWEYVFIIEYENSKSIKKNLSLLKRLKKRCDYFDYLGSY